MMLFSHFTTDCQSVQILAVVKTVAVSFVTGRPPCLEDRSQCFNFPFAFCILNVHVHTRLVSPDFVQQIIPNAYTLHKDITVASTLETSYS